MISSVAPLQAWAAERRGLRHRADCRAILKSKNWGGLAPDERQRGKIMRRVACGSITTDGSQRDLTGKMGTHGQLLCSSTLSSSLFSEAVSFQAPTLPSTQPSLTSSLSWHVTWLPYKKQPEGNALHFINWHRYPSETIHSIARNFTTVVSDIKWWTVGKFHRWRNLFSLSEYNLLLLLPPS